MDENDIMITENEQQPNTNYTISNEDLQKLQGLQITSTNFTDKKNVQITFSKKNFDNLPQILKKIMIDNNSNVSVFLTPKALSADEFDRLINGGEDDGEDSGESYNTRNIKFVGSSSYIVKMIEGGQLVEVEKNKNIPIVMLTSPKFVFVPSDGYEIQSVSGLIYDTENTFNDMKLYYVDKMRNNITVDVRTREERPPGKYVINIIGDTDRIKTSSTEYKVYVTPNTTLEFTLTPEEERVLEIDGCDSVDFDGGVYKCRISYIRRDIEIVVTASVKQYDINVYTNDNAKPMMSYKGKKGDNVQFTVKDNSASYVYCVKNAQYIRSGTGTNQYGGSVRQYEYEVQNIATDVQVRVYYSVDWTVNDESQITYSDGTHSYKFSINSGTNITLVRPSTIPELGIVEDDTQYYWRDGKRYIDFMVGDNVSFLRNATLTVIKGKRELVLTIKYSINNTEKTEVTKYTRFDGFTMRLPQDFYTYNGNKNGYFYEQSTRKIFKIGEYVTIENDITVEYIPETSYILTCYKNDGTKESAEHLVYISNLQMPGQTMFSRNGYKILGWSETPTDTTPTYDNYQGGVDIKISKLYAIWGLQ